MPAQIAIARRALGWTQARLAAEAGVHPKAVAYWERQGDPTHRQLHTNGAPYRIRAVLIREGVTFEPNRVIITRP